MNNKLCKFYEDATIFDSDFNEIEYKYCTLFDDECKKKKRTKNCPYNLNKKIVKYKQALEEIRGIAKEYMNTPQTGYERILNRIDEVFQ